MNENAQKWVAALKSGEYKQGKNVLHRTNGEDRFCCLGVACDLFIKFGGELKVARSKNSRAGACVTYGGRSGQLPISVRDWLGLASTDGDYYPVDQLFFSHDLTQDNDAGKKFTTIAKIIESEPKGLFKKTRKKEPVNA